GEEVAVIGQGVVGLLLTQLLSLAGARVTAVEPIAIRRDLALRCGADDVVAPEEALARIATRTDGRGADVVIEASGNASALQLAIDAAAFQGLRRGVLVVRDQAGEPRPGLALPSRATAS